MVPKATLVPIANSNVNDEAAASLNDFLAEILAENNDKLAEKKAPKNRP
jgi:hypothetical protein